MCVCIYIYIIFQVISLYQFSSVQSLSHVWLFVTLWTTACQASLSITNSRSPPRPMSIESVMPSNHLILCCPLLLLPSIFPSISIFFKWVSSSHQVAKVLEFQPSASVFPMNTQDRSPLGWTGWISSQSKGLSGVFSNTTVQKASILQHSAFFTVQLSHPYMTTGKTIALTRWTFIDKVMSLLFNMYINIYVGHNFPSRSKHLFISWLQSPSAVISEPRKIKSATVSTVSPSICHEVMWPDAMILGCYKILSIVPCFLSLLLISPVCKGSMASSNLWLQVCFFIQCFSIEGVWG